MPSDEELMQAVAEGKIASFEILVARHQKSTWHLAYRFLRDHALAEDVAQEAFLRVLNSAARWRPKAKFRTYLYRITIRLCRDFARKKAPISSDKLHDAEGGGLFPDESAAAREQRLYIGEAIASLPPNQRTAVILRYYHDLGYGEIAAVLGTTAKGVERLLARARTALRAKLEKF